MPDPQPRIAYETGAGDRDRWLNFAEDTARLTIPSLEPRGHRRSATDERPHTTEGTTAVLSLGSQALKILMPPGVLWGEKDLPPYIWKFLEQRVNTGEAEFGLEDITNLKRKMQVRSQDIIKSLNQRNTRSRIGAAIRRNLVEGSTAIHNAPPQPDADPRDRIFRPDGIRIFPLRSHVVWRNEYGQVRILGLKEEIEPDPMTIARAQDMKNVMEIWTLIDYETQEIWRQIGARGDPFLVEDERVDGYFVFTSEIPDIENYPHPYFWNFLRLIAQIDHAEASMAEAMADASWSPVGIKEGSTLAEDPDAVTEKRSGEPIVHQEGDIFFPNVGRKITDWAWVAQMRNDDKRELDGIAAKGIKDRAISADTSATAIIEIIDELETQTQDLLSAYEDTLQRPLFESEAAIHEAILPLLEPGTDEELLGEFIQTTITTGVSALSKQRAMTRFIGQGLAVLQKLDPTLLVHGENAADRIGEGMLIETEGLYSTAEPTGAAVPPDGEAGPREETIMTRGGPQPPQPPQPGSP